MAAFGAFLSLLIGGILLLLGDPSGVTGTHLSLKCPVELGNIDIGKLGTCIERCSVSYTSNIPLKSVWMSMLSAMSGHVLKRVLSSYNVSCTAASRTECMNTSDLPYSAMESFVPDEKSRIKFSHIHD